MSQIKVDSIVPRGGLPGGANGGIIQIVQSFKSDGATTTSTSFVDVGLSCSITPQSSSSKILVLWDLNCSKSSGVGHINLVRGSTNIAQPDGSESQSSSKQFYAQSHATHRNVSQVYLDSPSTTSTTTYKLQYRNEASSTFGVNIWYTGSNYRSVSSLTLMEVST